MKSEEIISGLEAMLERARLADRKLNASIQLERVERRMTELEERVKQLENQIDIIFNRN